jgi:hypothetical protein
MLGTTSRYMPFWTTTGLVEDDAAVVCRNCACVAAAALLDGKYDSPTLGCGQMSRCLLTSSHGSRRGRSGWWVVPD